MNAIFRRRVIIVAMIYLGVSMIAGVVAALGEIGQKMGDGAGSSPDLFTTTADVAFKIFQPLVAFGGKPLGDAIRLDGSTNLALGAAFYLIIFLCLSGWSFAAGLVVASLFTKPPGRGKGGASSESNY